jgi:hypothetical protein
MNEQLTLKDYKQMEKNRVYYFDNLSVVYDGKTLLSHYSQELFWHPFDENEEWFVKWKGRELTITDKYR